MADDQERTEEATPKKRADAHEEGRVPRSQELNTAALLLGSALILGGLGPAMGEGLAGLFARSLAGIAAAPGDAAGAAKLLQETGWQVMAATAPLLLALTGVALGINAVQARGVLTSKGLEPKWEKLNPLTNAKRIVGVQSLAELVKSLAKLLIVGIAVYAGIGNAWGESLALAQGSPLGLLTVVRLHAVGLLKTAGLAYIALAGADYLYQLWQHEKGLKMSKEEVKQEMKQSEGDPMVKARMRSMGRQNARRQMFRDVPDADVVITNPTHIAVALKYDPEIAPAPVVLAMGQRKVAERIKQIAKENGVPCVENRPIARALLASAKVGTIIPAELYMAVAEVLAFVIRSRATRGQWTGSAKA